MSPSTAPQELTLRSSVILPALSRGQDAVESSRSAGRRFLLRIRCDLPVPENRLLLGILDRPDGIGDIHPRLLPDIEFDLETIRIAGPPWNTMVAVDWLETNSATDGIRTYTPGVHVVRLVWGKMDFVGIYPDTVGLVSTLRRLATAGVAEAGAAMIQG